jgi:hypothetical protein
MAFIIDGITKQNVKHLDLLGHSPFIGDHLSGFEAGFGAELPTLEYVFVS